MKKKSGSRTGRALNRIINLRLWCDWDRMVASTKYLFYGSKKYLTPQKQTQTESFATAALRLNLSSDDLRTRQQGLLRISILMLGIATILLAYVVYNLCYLQFLSAGVSVIVMGIALVLAFRYHFWYFQIKKRQLGCSVSQWFSYLRGKDL